MQCEGNPFYRVLAWLAIHLELQVISSLNAPPVLSANSKMTTKKRKKEQTVKRLERKHETQNDKKHVQSQDSNSPYTQVWLFPAINHKNIQNKRVLFTVFNRDEPIQH